MSILMAAPPKKKTILQMGSTNQSDSGSATAIRIYQRRYSVLEYDDTEQYFFTIHQAERAYIQLAGVADTYETVVDISGGGGQFWGVISQYTAVDYSEVTIEVTIDGEVYERTIIAGVAGSRVCLSDLLVRNNLVAPVFENVSRSGAGSAPYAAVFSASTLSASGSGMDSTASYTLLSHRTIEAKQIGGVEFNHSLKVRIKADVAPDPAAYADYAMALYELG